MYKILASVLAILLSTQMVVPLAFAAEQSEGNAGKGSRDVAASELSEEAALGAASLTIPRTSSTASGTTVSAASAEKGATSSAAAKPSAADPAAQTGASASADGSTGASASASPSTGASTGTSPSTTDDTTPSTAEQTSAADSAALPTASNSNAAKSAHFSLNQNTIGNDGLSTSVTITLDCSGKEGDSFVLKISK